MKIVAAHKKVAYDPFGWQGFLSRRRSRMQNRACRMVGILSTYSTTAFVLVGLASLFATLIGSALLVSKYYFIPLSMLALLIVWTLFVPVPIPTPPFRSALVTALETSNATLRAIQRDNITADAEAVARFLPIGSTVKEAESVLRKELFYCSPFQDDGAREAARGGEEYRHYMICKRYTYYHPFYMFGWKIELFASRDDVIESVRAIRWYDGL
jgi:hypothetical protein